MAYLPHTPFTTTDFHDLVDSDIWVLEQMLTLPADPEPVVTKTDQEIRVELFDTVAMPQMQDAVRDYRRRLLPAVFVTAQKVYGELFRVVLGSMGLSADNHQSDVEKALRPIVSAKRILIWHPFSDSAHFTSWWSGQYDFGRLRRARNQVVHNRYRFGGGHLTVADEHGAILIDWPEHDTLAFIDGVRSLSKRV